MQNPARAFADQAHGAVLVWFRRDLRDHDHAALHAALRTARAVHCAFVFDTDILESLSKTDRRVSFIWDSVHELKAALEARGGGLHVLHGRAVQEIPALASRLAVSSVFANRDYEPQAITRDDDVALQLRACGIAWHSFKDQVVFELAEVRTQAQGAFTVYTPYKNAWLRKLAAEHVAPLDTQGLCAAALVPAPGAMPSLEAMGFVRASLDLPSGMSGGAALWRGFKAELEHYAKLRDLPAANAGSRLAVHLRFGTVSVRELVRYAHAQAQAQTDQGAQVWLAQLIWRDFYFAILAARPDVVDHAFRPAMDHIVWQQDAAAFQAWCDGRTGYPLVDAAMRELNTTGHMHNRLRMVCASFLVKDLGLDWRLGERYFARHLLDYDLAANNGGWQWCASTGCDAQPWFRVFNPNHPIAAV